MDTISPDIQRAALQLVQHLLKRQDNGTDPVEPEDPGLAPPPNTYNPGDTAWVLTSTALVFLMIPGLGYFYSGLARSKNALSLIFVCYLSMTVVALQWFLFGYSLSFGSSGNPFIGNCDYCLLRSVWWDAPAGAISSITFTVFQLMFASITPAIIFGSAAERIRILPAALFIFIWTTIVYDPLAYWHWGPSGWAKELGALDFAGGTVVHISSGFASLAYAYVVGKRHGESHEFKPHSVSNIALGTGMLWFGWFGFNGGSALASNDRAAMAALCTHLSAATAGGVWSLLDYIRKRKWSLVGYCSGAVSGLVGITPAAGFVSPASALAIGALTSLLCHFAVEAKHKLGYDDALDCFGIHGVGGFFGCFLTGIFAENSIASLDGASIPGGWLDQNWIQVPIQLASAVAGAAWSFAISFIILFAMNKIPGLALRLQKDAEMLGTDQAEHGEDAYEYVSSLSQTQEWGYSGSASADKKEAIAAVSAAPTAVVAETPVATQNVV